MNITQPFCRLMFERNVILQGLSRKIYTCHVLQHQTAEEYINTGHAHSSLWFTTIPRKAKNPPGRRKKPQKIMPTGPVIIQCKRKEFNHHAGQGYKKLDEIPLASKTWLHKKSKGDYFTILPTTEHPAFLIAHTETQQVPLSFQEMGLKSEIIERLKEINIHYPTAIQAKSIPTILKGHNALIAADTGCGKTMAYLLPIMHRILNWKEQIKPVKNSPLAMIVVPTRELAIQVGMVARKLGKPLGITSTITLGGHSKQLLLNPELHNVDILISTIGVICKLTNFKHYSTRNCKHVVVDEADTLMDDSFDQKLTVFLKRFQMLYRSPEAGAEVPSGTHLSLVSATMPTSLPEKLAEVVAVDSIEKITTHYLHRIQSHVPQTFLRMRKSQKPEMLLKIAKKAIREDKPLMIFSNKTETSNWISLFLNENGIKCMRINKSIEPEERLTQFQEFRVGDCKILSCTDLTSRGLDTTKVKHVLNYDFPMYMADYVHRCGRTGRINHDADCCVTNFVGSRRDVELVQKIEAAARTEQELPNVNNNIARIIFYKAAKKEGIA